MATNEETSAAGSDTRPPMLVENDYDSWKIRIHRYIRGKPHGRLIWKSIQDGPLPHPMITDPQPKGSTVVPMPRKKLDSEFSDEENTREMADTQAEIILSQGLPRHIFNILNQTSTAKEIWDNVELLMQGSGRTPQQRKEDLFDKYERFRAIGNESIHDYFVRFHKLVNDMKITRLEIPTHQMNTKFFNNLSSYWAKYVTNVKHNIDISSKSYVDIYTHLKAYEPQAKKTLLKLEQSSSLADPLAYVAHTNTTIAKPSPSTPSPQTAAQTSNEAMMATMTQIANLLSGFHKQKAPGNVGNNGARGKKVICFNCRGEGHVSRQCKEPKRKMDSQYFKDKMMLMEAKEKGATLDAEAKVFLIDVECTAPYNEPLAMITTNMFQANHEDAYDSDVDEGPNANVAFMANLTSKDVNEEEHLGFVDEYDFLTITIPYKKLSLVSDAENVSTKASAATSDQIAMIATLNNLTSQVVEHAKTNQEITLENETLKNELVRCKQEIGRLDTQKIKLDPENQIREEQGLVIQRNQRNAKLLKENELLKFTLSAKDKSIEFLKSEKEKVLTDKKELVDSYL
nr:hypothetical protein [Tanacetum cinerariifolium]